MWGFLTSNCIVILSDYFLDSFASVYYTLGKDNLIPKSQHNIHNHQYAFITIVPSSITMLICVLLTCVSLPNTTYNQYVCITKSTHSDLFLWLSEIITGKSDLTTDMFISILY